MKRSDYIKHYRTDPTLTIPMTAADTSKISS